MYVNQLMGRHHFMLYATILALLITIIAASGCHHQCDCGFQWSGDDASEENTTLRYEVMGGLIGSFSPLLLAGVGYLIFKKLNCSSSPSPSGGRKGSTPPWRERPWLSSGKISPSGPGPRGSTPISLYGETDDSFLTGSSSLPSKFNQPASGGVPGGAPMPMTDAAAPLTSQYRNIHRNFPGNELNQWFRNVNTTKY